jgi:hypothetical protein
MNNQTKNKTTRRDESVAPMDTHDYVAYRMDDLASEEISRPGYDMVDNCRNGDSHSYDLLGTNDPGNAISNTFFSKRNIKIIQNGIRANVFRLTEEVISEQDVTQVMLVMRFVYFNYSKHLPYNIQGQIRDLNSHVIKYIYPLVVGELKQYAKYIQDSYSSLRPQEHPEQTNSYGQRQYSMFQEF